MLTYTLTRTGYRKHCVLTGPLEPIIRIEFTNPRDASLFAQNHADGYRATLSIVSAHGGYEGFRLIPPAPGTAPREEVPDLMHQWQGMGNPTAPVISTPPPWSGDP